MKAVNDSFDSRFPGMRNLMRTIEDLGMRRMREEGVAYILTGTGRRLPADEGKVYTLVNYLIQGTSAEVLKLNILKCDAAGLTPYLIVPVHDELVLSVPKAEQEEIGKTLQECMTTRDGWTVPLLAGAPETGDRWGELG
jgi:DNA polymerase-1